VKSESSTARHVSNQIVDVSKIETPSTTEPISVAVVEDDENFREALVFQLVTAGFQVAACPSAESFLESSRSEGYDCIVADICLPRMNGLQLLAEIKQSVPFVSIIFVTGRGDISIGVQAMREGAVDCLEKPIDDQTLLNSIKRATDLYRTRRAEDIRRLELRQREGTLTRREHEVFGLITSGLLNKQVGATLGATERTIKTHRGRVMNKMSADSLADLVRMAEILRIQPIFASSI
jgi:FixJ family two-component response regulator